MMEGLFGEDFEIKLKEDNVKKVVKKATSVEASEKEDVDKILKSNKVSLEEKLATIKENVYRVLGKQKENIVVIRNKKDFDEYIDSCIKSGKIAIDTETNNSLDPVTCKIAGLCLYYPGGKQAYIPVNHVNYETMEKLPDQCTEEDIREEMQKVNDSKILRIFHNGKFDYEVIKCTCGIEVDPDWDTMVCQRLLNENEKAGLKALYRTKIDPTQEKYDIENLFEHLSYLVVDPEIFAYYAATDSLMTYKIYELQEKELSKDEYGPHIDIAGKHEVWGIRRLFHDIEMPLVKIIAEMELEGVDVDLELGKRLKSKYDKKLAAADEKINSIMEKIGLMIESWRLSPEANERTRTYVAKKSKMAKEKIEKTYPLIDEKTGERYKLGKTKTEQLEEPINFTSPIQLAILLYDILKCPEPRDGRATGEEEIDNIVDGIKKYQAMKEMVDTGEVDSKELSKYKSYSKITDIDSAKSLCEVILERRGFLKLLTTYIDIIPELTKYWPDGRIRFHLNQNGADTGRLSSGGKLAFNVNGEQEVVSGINIQNIPSGCPEIRLLFRGSTKYHKVEETDSYFIVPETDEVETSEGWKQVEDVKIGDVIIGDETNDAVVNIVKKDRDYVLYI